MSYATQARPYAVAAYDIAQKNNRIEEWWRYLLAMRDILSFKKMKAYVSNPTVDLDQKIDVLQSICKDWLFDDAARFTRLLVENERLPAIDDICLIFQEKKEEASQKVRAVFMTAFELDVAQQNALVATISKKIGLNLQPEFSVDPDIIGGAVIRFNGNVLDISVRNQLAQLKQNLIR